MAMTRSQWENLQRRLPPEDRTSYEEYLAATGETPPAAETGFITTPSTGSTMFTGPIPVGATRTETGYTTAEGETVEPQTPFVIDDKGDIVENPVFAGNNPPPGKTVTRTEIIGSGANRVIRTWYSDGSYTDTPSPDNTPPSMTPEQIQKAIDDAVAKATKGFQDQLAAQQKAAEQARLDQLAKERKSAYDIITERFTQMGVPEFGDVIAKIFRGEGVDRRGNKFDEIPTTSEGFYLQLIQTQPYYERFGQVNEARLAAGYRALDEKTIVGMEDEYQKVLTSYNAPKGFYDQTKDFQMFLKNNYTSVDVANVFQAYRDFVQSTDPTIRGQLRDLYGVNDDMLTAYFADPERGQPILESITGKNLNTAAALLEGLTKEQADIAQQYGSGSLAYGTQRQKFSQVARDIQQYGNLAAIYGENFGAKEAIAAEFGADTQSQQIMERLKATNLAQFSGASGVGQRALRTRTQ